MKLWVDDLRPAPEGWRWVKTSQDAIDRLIWARSEFLPQCDEISFDHDLGGDDTTRRVVLWMAENDYWPPVVKVHTANPVGRDWLVGMVTRYGPGVTL